mgnify:CR=1 FL=1
MVRTGGSPSEGLASTPKSLMTLTITPRTRTSPVAPRMMLSLALAVTTHTPIIAVISHPTALGANEIVEGSLGKQYMANETVEGSLGKQYMAASYVKWIEMAGGRVLPFSYHSTDDEVDAIFAQANGALFMGGGADLPKAARRLWAKAAEANAAGDPFPIWGSCLGFEWIMQLASADDKILVNGLDSENLTLPLNLTDSAATSRVLGPASKMPVPFESPPLSVLDALETLPITMNNHHSGVTPAGFAGNDALSKSLKVLATNFDRKGREFGKLRHAPTRANGPRSPPEASAPSCADLKRR